MNLLFDPDAFRSNKRFRNDAYEAALLKLLVIGNRRRRGKQGNMFTAQHAIDIANSNAKVSADGSINTHNDVNALSPVQGDILAWDGTNWTNVRRETGATPEQEESIIINNAKVSADGSINTHNDVNTLSPVLGDVLSWDGTNWINITASAAQELFCPAGTQQAADIIANNAKVSADGSINTHNDVTISNALINQVLSWNGSQWVNRTLT